ncbi:MAG: hypothetical protein AAFP03_16785 [Cyanobacteria bacterium J06598_3]
MNAPSVLPTEANHFKARYKTSIGVALLTIGLVATVLTLWVMLLDGQFSSSIISGILPTIIGFLYLTRPYFVIAPNRLTIYSPIGKAVKRYPFANFKDLKIIDGKLYIESSDRALTGAEKVKVSKGLVHAKDWKAIESFASKQA